MLDYLELLSWWIKNYLSILIYHASNSSQETLKRKTRI